MGQRSAVGRLSECGGKNLAQTTYPAKLAIIAPTPKPRQVVRVSGERLVTTKVAIVLSPMSYFRLWAVGGSKTFSGLRGRGSRS